MTSKHDSMNTGFEDVVDFCEPEMRTANEVDLHSIFEELESRKPRSLLAGILINNVWAVVIHAAVLMLSLVCIVFFGFDGELLAVLIGFPVYIALGYTLLSPLPKYNWLSVVCLAAMLGLLLVSTSAMTSSLADIHLSAMYWLNLPANFAAILMVLNAGLVESYDNFVFERALVTVAPITVFVPSLLIYLGLLMKIRLSKDGHEKPIESYHEIQESVQGRAGK